MFDFRLKVFCSVAQNLSFTKASRKLNITQPAITKHIQELEQEFNTKLFVRLNNRIELTSAGELLLIHAEHILDSYKKLDMDMKMLSHEHKGQLRLGADSIAAQYILPPFMAAFAERFKHIHLSLVNTSVEEIEQAVANGDIDLGMVGSVHRNPNLRYTPFVQDELMFVASSHSTFAAKKEITLQELLQTPLVIDDSDTGCNELLRLNVERLGIDFASLNVTMQLTGAESVKRYIEYADCVAVLSRQVIMPELMAGKYKVVDVAAFSCNREFAFVRAINETDDIVKDFIDFLLMGI